MAYVTSHASCINSRASCIVTHVPLSAALCLQVAVGARPALFHDEFKLRLPAVIQPHHHLLFTLLHIDPATRADTQKPVSRLVA